jgi:2-polyprenyl-3-methyl-5-hydroxy-6-metoxy-1,4-benzoquinol methylase
LCAEVASVIPGRALDAGCGHGAETLWLAARGWHVTAVDFSAASLSHGQAAAASAGADIAGRIDWVQADLTGWVPEPGRYDLVVCLYVHIAGCEREMVRRMADGVAPGGTLFLAGHRPIDPSTGEATAAANQVQVSVDGAIDALDPEQWEIAVAEERQRSGAGSGVDAVIRAQRRSWAGPTS